MDVLDDSAGADASFIWTSNEGFYCTNVTTTTFQIRAVPLPTWARHFPGRQVHAVLNAFKRWRYERRY